MALDLTILKENRVCGRSKSHISLDIEEEYLSNSFLLIEKLHKLDIYDALATNYIFLECCFVFAFTKV
jgi:hypothetical protein